MATGVGGIENVRALMARQNGVVSREQTFDLGMTDAQIKSQLRNGTWLSGTRGIYIDAGSPSTWERTLRAALLSQPRALVAGRSAAHLHGFPGVRRSRGEILVPYGRNHRLASVRVIRSRHFDSVSTSRVAGFDCTSIAETILTMSLRELPTAVERHVDGQLAAGSLEITDFDPILDRLAFARQPGLAALRRIVRERSDKAYQPPTTELERLLYRLLDRPEIPPYERQLPIDYPRMRATHDAYIPDWILIAEADGRRWHVRKGDFERDRRRDNAAVAAGIAVIRFTWSMLKYEPEECLRTLVAAGRTRARV